MTRRRYPAAETLLRRTIDALRRLDHREGDIATAQRFLALAVAQQGDVDQALDLLRRAEVVFLDKDDVPELDELYDDRAEVHLLRGDYEAAKADVARSLEQGRHRHSRAGEGRSQLLLAKIAMETDEREDAKKHIDAADDAYESLANEVGQAEAWRARGDWHAKRGGDGDLERAILEYKRARRLEHDHLDRRGVALCNCKLVALYLERRDFARALDALEEAEAALEGIDDPRQNGQVELLWGRLWLARGEHGQAAARLQRAFEIFRASGRSDALAHSRHLLVTSLLAEGRSAAALEAMHDIGEDDSVMYGVLVQGLHDDVAAAAAPSLRAAKYGAAINAAFGVVERMIRDRTARLAPALQPKSDKLYKHRQAWLQHGTDLPEIPVSMGIENFGAFIQGSFGLLRNSATHEAVDFSAADAFAAIAASHLIARVIDNSGLPWCNGARHASNGSTSVASVDR